MNEIEKMYENAGIKCLHPSGFCKHIGATCEGCERHKHPPFTAEKQLELFKLLIRHYKTEIYCRYANDKYKLIIYTEDCCTSDMDSFENALASVVCDIWGLLTEEEKQQIKEILE
jgi:hypothetical protein